MVTDRSNIAGDPAAAASKVAREAGVALWRQIVAALEDEIASGKLTPGARLPTEAQLAERFAVNRHTVRRALEEMQRSGLVRVEQGRGSFVAEDVLDYAVAARTRFSEWIRRHNKEPSGQTIDLCETQADAVIAAGLGLAPNAPIVRLERLGFADGRPVGISTHCFSQARFPLLFKGLQTGLGISEALAQCGLTDYRRLVTRVSARLPSQQEASLLRLPRNRPLLVTENINVDAQGAPVEYGIGRYPTPRVQIVFEP